LGVIKKEKKEKEKEAFSLQFAKQETDATALKIGNPVQAQKGFA
jgi:hypothetical protein